MEPHYKAKTGLNHVGVHILEAPLNLSNMLRVGLSNAHAGDFDVDYSFVRVPSTVKGYFTVEAKGIIKDILATTATFVSSCGVSNQRIDLYLGKKGLPFVYIL